LAAWREFCRVLSETGEAILGPRFPSGDREPVEGIRHLATSTANWLTTAFSAELDLGMYRLNDLLTPWGGPNADNVYHHARIDDQGTYRLRGRMHSCQEFLLALRIANMHQEVYGTLGEISATDLGIGPGDEVDVLFSPSGEGGVAIPPGTRMIAVREYYYDWQQDEPATLILERLDGVPTPGGVVAALNDAGDQVRRSVTFWNEYMHTARGRGVDNTFIPPRREPKGLAAMHYSFCFWSLRPDEALVVRFSEPVARYWSVQLYQLGWFEWLDIGRPTSLNHTQAAAADGGTVTVVLSATDPGFANWLDTEGRPEGLLTLRCAWLSAAAPKPTTEVVKLADLERVLGPGEARLDGAGRAKQIDDRRAHLRWRFRT
jgi:hypothetical protein